MNKIIKAFIIFLLLQPCYPANAQVTDTIRVEAGWNMISLPLKVQDAYYLTIFPDAISPPYEYILRDPPDYTLRIGRSYWIKFASAKSYIINGEAIQSLIKDVTTGWNMIGSITNPVPISSIKSDPPGIIISDYFEYNASPGYEKVDTIIPGAGYWVKVNQDGNLILTSMGYPCPGIPNVEYEGKTYSTVQIGNQCWLKENLDVGTMILMISESDTAKNNGIIEKYCCYNDTTCCTIYGGLYPWSEAMQYTTIEGVQGICPPGWHVPTYQKFQILKTVVEDGNALKAIGQGTGAGAGTNTSGFSALLAGLQDYYCHMFECFHNLGYSTYFWSSSETDSVFAYYLSLTDDTGNLRLSYGSNKEYGFSVRCLKD